MQCVKIIALASCEKFVAFYIQTERILFSFIQNIKTFIHGKHSEMVEPCEEKERSCMPEAIFDLSSFEDVVETIQRVACEIHNMMIMKRLVG